MPDALKIHVSLLFLLAHSAIVFAADYKVYKADIAPITDGIGNM